MTTMLMPRIISWLGIFLFLCSLNSGAQIGESALDVSGEELLFSQVSVASLKAMTLQESPGIVSVISAEEIANAGARDLIDILRLVPGFEFGVDVFGVVGAGFRGNWAHEGKIALLLDGQEFTELLYSNLQFGNHFPVDQIKKIEIIRGPGSAIYGGFAELAVINIITKEARDINGLALSLTNGQMAKTFARRNLSLSWGKIFNNNLSLVGSTFWGQGNRSDQNYTDINGYSYNMAGNSDLNPLNINLNMFYKGLNSRVIIDRYQMTYRDELVGSLSQAVKEKFDSYFFNLGYDYKLSDTIILTPRFNYKKQKPWNIPAISAFLVDFPDTPIFVYDTTVERYTGDLRLSYDYTNRINIIVGTEFYGDKAKDNLRGSYSLGGEKAVSYFNNAGYFQGLVTMPLVNLTAGMRYDSHSHYGASFVPRIGVTKVIDRFHFKLLRSNAFRSPGIENIGFNKEIKPERTRVTELETGFQFSKSIFATANLFDINIDRPIIYFFDTILGKDTYLNFNNVHTRGLEIESRLKKKWGYSNLNYSYYKVIENNVVRYEVPGRDDILLGLPMHKVSLNSSVKIFQRLNVNPSFSYLSERFGYYSLDADGNPLAKRFGPIVLTNLFFNYHGAFQEDLNIGIGVYDLFDQRYEFIQPYNGGHSPLPGTSREIILKVSYKY